MSSYRPSALTSLGIIAAPFATNMSGYLNHYQRRGNYHKRKGRYSNYQYRFPRNRLSRIENTLRQLSPEMHYIDFSGGATLAAATLNNKSLASIGQGDGRSGRTGTRIRIHKVEMRATANSTSSTYEIPVGFFLLLSKSTQASPTLVDFTANDYPMINEDQFTELKSWSTKCSINSDSQTTRRCKYFKPPLVVEYDGASATDVIMNELFFSVVNNSAADSATFNYNVRVYFTG